MNETQVNAQFAALVEQRNNALNQVVNMAGALAEAGSKIKELTAQLEAATAIIEEEATIVEGPTNA